MFDIAISIRDNGEWLKSYLLSYKKYTRNPYNYIINIIDTSTIENKKLVEDTLFLFPDLNIRLYHGNRDIHYHKTWTEIIRKSEQQFVLFTHIDIVYLMKDWDIFLIDQLANAKTLISVSVRSKIYPESVWICCYRDLLIKSGFDHETINSVLVEHGKIITLHNMTQNNSIYINDMISVPKYGDIALLNNNEFIYHNYYSSRVKDDNLCPVPLGPESSYLEQREDFAKTISKLEKYLTDSKTDNLSTYLTDT